MTSTAVADEELKMTEIGLLPPEWQVVRLGDVAKLTMGQSPPGNTYNTTGKGFPYLQGKAEFGSTAPRHIKYTTRPQKIAPRGSVLISVRAPVGDVNIADIDYCIGRGLASLSMHAGDNTFLFYMLSYRKEDLEAEGTGSTFKAINKSKLQAFPFAFPPPPEQKKIAYVLSTVQTAIEKTEVVIRAARELKKSLMKHLFTYGPVSIDEAESVPLKETEIGMVPDRVDVVKLGDVVRTQYGYTASACHDQVGPQFLRITDIDDDGNVNWSAVPYCMVSTDDYHRFSLEDGDTVVARIGATTGKAYFAVNSPRSVFASYLIRLKVKDKDKVYPAFISAFTKSVAYWTQVNQSKGEKLKSGLSARQLEHMLIPLPPFHIQQKSATALSVMETKLKTERSKKVALEALFRTLLSSLMTGKIRVDSLRCRFEWHAWWRKALGPEPAHRLCQRT